MKKRKQKKKEKKRKETQSDGSRGAKAYVRLRPNRVLPIHLPLMATCARVKEKEGRETRTHPTTEINRK